MGIKSISLAVIALVSTTITHASIIDNGTHTTDSASGLDWLDITETANRSFNDISSQLGVGGEFEGWRYATALEITGFFDAFGGDSSFYEAGSSTQNNGLFDAIAPMWGDIKCQVSLCLPGEGGSGFYYDESPFAGEHWSGLIDDSVGGANALTHDFVAIHFGSLDDDMATGNVGSALVRSVVPIPATVWLFGSGLLGLIGIARRKKV